MWDCCLCFFKQKTAYVVRISDWRSDVCASDLVRKVMADREFEHADYVLSGLPFSTLPPGVGPKIAEETAEALRPGGAFLVYQFSPKVRDYISPHFDRIDKGFEWINIPPATLFWAWKD